MSDTNWGRAFFLSEQNRVTETKQKWFDGKLIESGRIDVEGRDLSKRVFPGADLEGARFVQCNFTGANIREGSLTDAEIIECIWNDALFFSADLDRSLIKDCRIVAAYMKMVHFIEAKVQGGDWSNTDLYKSTWTGAVVENVCFQKANFTESRLHGTHLVDCDFWKVNLNIVEAYGAVFERCDFRGAYLRFFEFKNTTFKNCAFHGCIGTPKLKGDCQIIEPDISANFDGTGIIEEKQLRHIWGLDEEKPKPGAVIIVPTPLWIEERFDEQQGKQMDWINGGHVGNPPLVIEDKNYSGTFAYEGFFKAGRLTRCDLSDSDLRLAKMQEAQLHNCRLDNSLLMGLQGQEAHFVNCQIRNAILNRSEFADAVISGGDWSGSQFRTCMWYDARVENVSFCGTNWFDGDLEGARFVGCDFRDADLTFVNATKAVFDRCDFRGANLDRLTMWETMFVNCGFYGCQNPPSYDSISDEVSRIIAPDLSENFDGTKIVEEQVVDSIFYKTFKYDN
jgi:uncharacterized protein YjbI with pentapeptide repeats